MTAPLRFAVDASPAGIAAAQRRGEPTTGAVDRLVRLARTADGAGISSLWATEDPDGWDAIAVLTILARETETIRIGPGVLNPWFRHPALIAASIATLDTLSGGRAFLGLGRGQTEWYQHALGMSVRRPLAAMEETITLLRQWWREPWHAEGPERAAADPRVFPVTAWSRATGPEQRHVPIVLAAVGPKALALAARHADGVLFNELSSVTFMERTIREVRESAREAGRDPDALTFHARAAVTVTDDPEAVWERRKDTVAVIHALPGMDRLLETPGYDLDGLMAEVRQVMRTDEVLARGGAFIDIRREGDLAAARRLIPTDLMRELVVAGPADDVRARLRRLREIGVTDVFLATPPDPEALPGIVAALREADANG